MEQKTTAPQLEIQNYLVVSTAHITLTDMRRLSSGDTKRDSMLILNSFDYGENIYTGDYKKPAWKIAEAEGFGSGLQNMLKLALDNGCRYLKLDRDGPVVEGYKIYDW